MRLLRAVFCDPFDEVDLALLTGVYVGGLASWVWLKVADVGGPERALELLWRWLP